VTISHLLYINTDILQPEKMVEVITSAE